MDTKIQDYVKENWASLPRSTFNGDELVIVREFANEDWGYGNHSYSGVGVDKEGSVLWAYSSGCSCNGTCGLDHAMDQKTMNVSPNDFQLEQIDPSEVNFSALQVNFADY